MSEQQPLRSYSSSSTPLAPLRQWRALARMHRDGVDRRVASVLAELVRIEADVFEHAGAKIEDCRVLDIGPGQHLMQMRYFAARGNQVVGVDRDVIAQGADPLGYWRMCRSNGVGRVAKTVGRKAMGIDRAYRRALHEHVDLHKARTPLTVHQVNAWDTRLDGESFDFVYSLRVFMHLERPAAALEEARRLLAPGGVAYIDVMPYTGPGGSLDLRELGGRSNELPAWAHLRQAHGHLVQESAYLNCLSAADWRRLIAAHLPGSTTLVSQPNAAALRPLAERLHDNGELLEHDVDDLVTSGLHVIWRKPRRACLTIMVAFSDVYDLAVGYASLLLGG